MGVGVGILIAAAICILRLRRRYRVNSITISIPFGLGSVTVEPSSEDRLIAWRMYVQLTTRKAALPFDEAHDVVVEIYSSLYELFPVTRELLSSMKLDDVARRKGVADVILRTLNDGLRPHLTTWNASFRQWWEVQVANKANKKHTPQELQQKFPRYKELVDDLKRTNTELSRFADELLAIARADRPRAGKVLPVPTQPRLSATGEERSPTSTTLTDSKCEPTTPYSTSGSRHELNSPHE
jgi:hypothetical protein